MLFCVCMNRISAGLSGLVVLKGHSHGAFPLLLVATFYDKVRVEKLGYGRSKSFKMGSDRLNPDMFSVTYNV